MKDFGHSLKNPTFKGEGGEAGVHEKPIQGWGLPKGLDSLQI